MNNLIIFARYLALSIGLIGFFAGCDEKLEPSPPTYSRLLTGTEKKVWRLVSFEVIDEGQKSGVIPIRNTQWGVSCRGDDQYVFYADQARKFEYNNGTNKCTSEETVLFEDSWALTNANATLEFVIPFFDLAILPYTIKNLTETSMTVEIYFDKIYVDPIDASYRFTFNSVTTK